MRIKLLTVLISLIIPVQLYSQIGEETRDWDFIQKVGGIKTGVPLETEEGYYLPVECNVSGTDSVTIKPTTTNSALTCLKINASVNGNAIHLKVITGLSFAKEFDCNCKAVRIGDLEPGDYKVFYGNKSSFEHPIGKFTIEGFK